MGIRYRIINRKKRIAVRIADFFGYAFFYPLILLIRALVPYGEISSKRIRKILVVRLAYIGDVIMTLPVLRPLKELFPDASISFLSGKRESEMLRGNPYIDHIITYDAFWFYKRGRWGAFLEYVRIIRRLRQERFDIAIDFRGDIRNILLILFLCRVIYRVSYSVGGGGYLLTHRVPYKGITHRIDYHINIVRYLGNRDYRDNMPRIFLSPDEIAFKDRIFNRFGFSKGDTVIGIHPGGRKPLKCWYTEGYIDIMERLLVDTSIRILLTGSKGESLLCDRITGRFKSDRVVSLCGQTTLRELSSLISGLRLFITSDSAPMHIACAVNTPTVAIFGPSKSNETGPYGGTSLVVERRFPCRYTCDENRCTYKIFNGCMKAIDVDDVHSAILEIFARIVR